MHSSSLDTEVNVKDGGDVLVAVGTLVTEGRIPGQSDNNSKQKKFHEGPHCILIKGAGKNHKCDLTNSLCQKFEKDRETVLNLCQKGVLLCIEVFLTCVCKEINNTATDTLDNAYLLEQWHFSINSKRDAAPVFFNLNQLVSAIRSQLYFSQITAWLTIQDGNSTSPIIKENLRYRLTAPGGVLAKSKFFVTATNHEFPLTDIGNGLTLNVSFFSAPRTQSPPTFSCFNCSSKLEDMELRNRLVDDRMHLSCTLKGKHRCEDYEEYENAKVKSDNNKRICSNANGCCEASTSKHASKPKLKVKIDKPGIFSVNYVCEKRNISPNIEKQSKSVKLDYKVKLSQQNCHSNNKNDLNMITDKGQLLLDAIERSGQESTNDKQNKDECHCFLKRNGAAKRSECDNVKCDMSESDIFSIKKKNNFNVYVDKHCDSPIPIRQTKIRDISNVDIPKFKLSRRCGAKQKITFDEKDSEHKTEENTTREINSVVEIPSPSEQAKFRKNLDNAASMVFHSRTGLSLTSSPAPVRKGKSCFDFDSSLNSVSAIKSALLSSSFSTDEESESEGSIVSPCSPEIYNARQRQLSPVKYCRKGHATNLLGSFEESVLNGRLEPVSTVHGFTAELGASGSFVPKHLFVPVTVFFYTLGDNDKVSSPYLGHINLGKKGYNVPKTGTVQVTLFNPLGTVVKMFVIMYDLSDMPLNSQTFIRQRTLYMPTNCQDTNLEWGPKWLRYLIHLRFMSSKSGKIYLHSDIRMIIFRKCDMDTATAHGIDMSYELRSFTHTPTNPRFSPRK